MRSYQDLVFRGRQRHGAQFDESSLDPRFIRYDESGQRVRVKTCGMFLTGTIGVTTGWKPCFLLMRTSRSTGSSWTLGQEDELIAVKQGRTYYHRTTV